MREISADAWSVDCDVLCITTNCTLYSDRLTQEEKNVMGGGIAAGAAFRFPGLPAQYARLIRKHGHHVFLIDPDGFFGGAAKSLLMFPTKNEVSENASLRRIWESIEETQILADLYNWKNIALPRPGAGLGGLSWESEVKPFLIETCELHLDDRFIIVSYPGEK